MPPAVSAATTAAAREYAALLRHIFSLQTGSAAVEKVGLRNSQRLCERLGRDRLGALGGGGGGGDIAGGAAGPARPAVVHVAGTNGKGSVCAKVAAACQQAGLRTGLFTSPHVSCFRERICVDGAKIPEEAVLEGAARVFRAAEAGEPMRPNFFEVTYALAADYFSRAECDVVVLETGMGGRLDPTNTCAPAVTCITSIGLDHCEFLGSTLDDVAREKAGIIKRGVPLVVGATCPPVVLEVAAARGAPVVPVAAHAFAEDENRALAAALLRTLSDTQQPPSPRPEGSGHAADEENQGKRRRSAAEGRPARALFPSAWLDAVRGDEPWLDARLPCRFERHRLVLGPTAVGGDGGGDGDGGDGGGGGDDGGRAAGAEGPAGPRAGVAVDMVLDVAHNAAGLSQLVAHVAAAFPDAAAVHIVAGFSQGKDVQANARALADGFLKHGHSGWSLHTVGIDNTAKRSQDSGAFCTATRAGVDAALAAAALQCAVPNAGGSGGAASALASFEPSLAPLTSTVEALLRAAGGGGAGGGGGDDDDDDDDAGGGGADGGVVVVVCGSVFLMDEAQGLVRRLAAAARAV